MFRIICEPVEESCNQLQRQMRQLDQIRGTTEDVMRSLRSMSGYDEVIYACRKECEKLDSEYNGMQDMTRGLGNVVLTYRNAENRIIQNGEMSIQMNHTLQPGMVQFDHSVLNNWNIKLT